MGPNTVPFDTPEVMKNYNAFLLGKKCPTNRKLEVGIVAIKYGQWGQDMLVMKELVKQTCHIGFQLFQI